MSVAFVIVFGFLVPNFNIQKGVFLANQRIFFVEHNVTENVGNRVKINLNNFEKC